MKNIFCFLFLLGTLFVSGCGPMIENSPPRPFTPTQPGEPRLSEEFLETPLHELPSGHLQIQITKELNGLMVLKENRFIQNGQVHNLLTLNQNAPYCQVLPLRTTVQLKVGMKMLFDQITFKYLEGRGYMKLLSTSSDLAFLCVKAADSVDYRSSCMKARELRVVLWNFAVLLPEVPEN